LKSILGVVIVQKDTATDAHDHGAMPIEQRREGIAIAMLDEKCKQLLIAQSAAVAQDEGTTDTVEKPIRHILALLYLEGEK
jgi:hypothetical protein